MTFNNDYPHAPFKPATPTKIIYISCHSIINGIPNSCGVLKASSRHSNFHNVIMVLLLTAFIGEIVEAEDTEDTGDHRGPQARPLLMTVS